MHKPGSPRHNGIDESCNETQTFQDMVKDRLQFFVLGFSLGEFPWGGYVYIFVDMIYEFPDRHQGLVKGEVLQTLLVILNRLPSIGSQGQIKIALCADSALRYDPFKVFVGHGQTSAKEVPEVICQIRIEAMNKCLFAEI